MKKSVLILIAVVLTATGCLKNDINQNCDPVNDVAPAAEVANLKAYLDSNNIVATADPRGFFYRIETPGSGTKPTVCNTVTVTYTGTLTSGKVFDSHSNTSFILGDLIAGWKEGIPQIAQGGIIYLYIPPSLGYGAVANGDIPANSNLIFKIQLSGVS